MHLILLSGGSGKRLWPLSSDARSKQFLKVLPKENGAYVESMVQRVYAQICNISDWESITVIAGAAQKELLELQLGKEVDIVIEPERRDTFPAIELACSYLYDKKNVSKDAVVAVLPVDPFVENHFFAKISEIETLINGSDADIVLLGVKPTYPSEKYGYMVPKKENDACMCDNRQVFDIDSFREKPASEEAEALIEHGALWNCGVFGFKLGYTLDILSDKYGIDDLSFENVYSEFGKLNKTSFDYEVVEHAKNIKAVAYNGEWRDLGTWDTLTEKMGANYSVSHDNIIIHSCANTHVISEVDLPVTVIGLDDTVVAVSYDGVLVSKKQLAHEVKNLMASNQRRPMFEEKRWGRYTVIEHTKYDDGSEALTKKLVLNANGQISYQYHKHRKEIWSIIKGTGILYLDGKKTEVTAGDVISIQEEQKHAIKAITELELIEVQIGAPLIEEDIVRLEFDW